MKLKKSHFGKPPLTECALRHPPCQSELAETPSEPAIHHEGNATSQRIISEEARNTYSEGAVHPRTDIVGRCPPETSSAKQDAGNGGRAGAKISEGYRSGVPELYCVFASKTLQCEGPSEGCLCCERPLRAISVRPLLPKETSFVFP